MTDKVIIDDGGSTRIRRILSTGVGAMDGLLDVDLTANPPQSTENINFGFTSVRIVSINLYGVPNTVLNSTVASSDSVTVHSDNGQTLRAHFVANGHLKLTVEGLAHNPPLVEAKQFHKRRYLISNAGAILKVSWKISSMADSFDATGAIYTTVVLS